MKNKKRELMRGLVRVCRGLHAIQSNPALDVIKSPVVIVAVVIVAKKKKKVVVVARQVLLW